MPTPPKPFDIFQQLAPLRRYALSLTRNPADAEDLVHDTLVKAIEKEGHFRPGAEARSWLFAILHNTFLDARRRSRTRAAIEVDGSEGADAAVPAGQDASMRLADVRRTFMALPEEQRAALHLVAVEGLSYDEAAASLAIPVGTLVSRVSRARAQLRAADADPSGNVVPFKARGDHDERAS
ncbi:sigma-70 family RNA polymerase sigma factor [Aureimonas sp. ME7]|uniref:sigma-70 family RNA polymerase sigma factor n=1 Tax=Aureimonas sp. ME7 TaxID=2744252 RepID=UPI0015F70947|nr:sigma-70 family RNA polymerase sigma factor [Aureimonas sp. ME7]